MSLPPDLCIRITLPYQDCSGIIQQWYLRANQAVCYEHEQDEEISKTHVHIALIGLDCKTEALKRMWSDAPGKGNEFWSFSPLRDKNKYFTYMTKGKLSCKIAKNISSQELEKSRLAWVEPSLGNDKSRADPTEFMIQKVIAKFSDDDIKRHNVYSTEDDSSLFDEVRSATMKVYWGETRRVPHATQYKIVASTVYLRIMEKLNRFDEGLAHVKFRWY